MKKLYIILSIILNTITNSSAQELTGQLKDSISEEPIADVLIKIDDTEIHTHTDAQGKFVIQNLNEATYDVSFSKFGYESFTRTVTIIKDQSTIIDTRMIVKSISLPTVSVAAERPVSAASSKHLSAIDFENRPKNSAQDLSLDYSSHNMQVVERLNRSSSVDSIVITERMWLHMLTVFR